MTTIPFLCADEEDDNLVSLTSIFNAIKSKLNIIPGVTGEWLRPGTVDPSELYVTLKVQREVSTLQLNSYKQLLKSYKQLLKICKKLLKSYKKLLKSCKEL